MSYEFVGLKDNNTLAEFIDTSKPIISKVWHTLTRVEELIDTCGPCDITMAELLAAYDSFNAIESPPLPETIYTSEIDTNGLNQHDPGAKLDSGKNRLGLVLLAFANALQEVGVVGTFGANKYTDNGWLSVPDGERRYTDAMLRHLLQEKTEGKIDKETGLLHSAQVAWNALARLQLQLMDKDES